MTIYHTVYPTDYFTFGPTGSTITVTSGGTDVPVARVSEFLTAAANSNVTVVLGSSISPLIVSGHGGISSIAINGSNHVIITYTDGTVVDSGVISTSSINVLAATSPDLLVVGVITRNANEAATSAAVTWPDGTPGTYTGTPSTTALGAVDSYTITYGSPVTRTYTQPAVTRDSAGAVTTRPAIVVT